jgi:hypothetical protein
MYFKISVNYYYHVRIKNMFWPTQCCRQRCASAKLPPPLSWPPPLPRCHHNADTAYAAVALPTLPTLRSCQAAASAAKLAAAASAALLPSCRCRHQAGCHPHAVTVLPPPPPPPLFPSLLPLLTSSLFPCF